MLKFLLKGLLRDKNRSLFPVISVTLGVMLTVLIHCWITGVMGDTVDMTAKFQSGHVKMMTRAYAENADQMPNDLAILGISSMISSLENRFPEMQWAGRIRFAGLIDVPDEHGETRDQGPASGLGLDLISPDSQEAERLNIKSSIVRGSYPSESDQILISDDFAKKLNVIPGDRITLISSTMFGSMAMSNFTVAGTVSFGITALDRGGILADIKGIQAALDMEDAAGELLGFFPGKYYPDTRAVQLTEMFNKQTDKEDEFAPVMLALRDQNDMGSMIDFMDMMSAILSGVFILAMAVVLWNAALLSGLRRYGEMGLRLAVGESKGHAYRSLLAESAFIGTAGSILGTAAGLGIAWLLQTYGIYIGDYMQDASMMMPDTIRAHITPPAYTIGFVPGVFATVLGVSLAGIGIYKRKTAQLFKELEV